MVTEVCVFEGNVAGAGDGDGGEQDSTDAGMDLHECTFAYAFVFWADVSIGALLLKSLQHLRSGGSGGGGGGGK